MRLPIFRRGLLGATCSITPRDFAETWLRVLAQSARLLGIGEKR